MSTLLFSVVIPTCGRNDLLHRCLTSLRPGEQLAAPELYEVIVTDDARGQTAEAMIRAEFPWVRWVQGPARGPAANRNHGARQATAEWICFIDDDCIASKEWLSTFAEYARDDSLDVLEGKTTIPDKSDNPFQHGVYNEHGGSYWSCNLAIRREKFLALDGFDEDFLEAAGEDMEFAHRFLADGLRPKFLPEALVLHPVRTVNWRGIFKRYFILRWTALYYYKVDQELHLSDSVMRNLLRALRDMPLGELRVTWHEWRGKTLYPKTRLFWLIIRWVGFPFQLCSYLYWVARFHAQLTARQQRQNRG
jgi:GT2 family glycosyltransferase